MSFLDGMKSLFIRSKCLFLKDQCVSAKDHKVTKDVRVEVGVEVVGS